jgi:hypothetical protein
VSHRIAILWERYDLVNGLLSGLSFAVSQSRKNGRARLTPSRLFLSTIGLSDSRTQGRRHGNEWILVSRKWQQTGGTAEQKVAFEVISYGLLRNSFYPSAEFHRRRDPAGLHEVDRYGVADHLDSSPQAAMPRSNTASRWRIFCRTASSFFFSNGI